MTFRGFYSDEQEGFRPQGALPSVSKRKKYKKRGKVLFIDKINRAARSGVLSGFEMKLFDQF
jgi:hypothetical protein